MTNPIDTGPASGTWAWAIQREIDNLQKTMESRYSELSQRIDRVVSGTEYNADKRAQEQQHTALLDRIGSIDKDVEIFKRDFSDRLEVLRKDHDADIDKVGLLLDTEKKTREADRKEDRQAIEDTANAQIEKKRWLIAAVMIPIAIALIPLLQMVLK
ncbi:hypothetical protein SEA_LUCKYSOCKE_62 [Streptomyces phage LuckySocke]|jgi:hypothetical protein|nr:hypothetical protein SEA_ALONE_62 [Streptomyces phage Alone3]WPH59006.1 hypothetical protein SEA_LUCKYSOCKE_62 [Streptomyces phage LuckySocke]